MGGAKKKRAEDNKSMSDAEGSLAVTNEQMVTDMCTLGNANTWLMEVENPANATFWPGIRCWMQWGDWAYECLQVSGLQCGSRRGAYLTGRVAGNSGGVDA